jgi:pyruvate dehydrogenase E2 component (dihydrolipoamide acetyltransferase)
VSEILRIGMPKWGLSMTEGKLAAWLVDEGAEVDIGQPVADVETEKIAGEVESPVAGVVRRLVAAVGEVVPVGGLLAVVAPSSVPDADVEAYVAEFQATFVPEAADEEGPAPQLVTVDGRSVRCLVEGSGDEAVVLLHGFGGDLDNWMFNRDALAGDDRRVISVDLPGHGGSAKDVGDGDLDAMVAVVVGLLDARDASRASLVGHSLGGAVAAGVAAAAPDRVRSLALIAPAGFGPEISTEYIEGFIAADSRRSMKPVLEMLFARLDLVTRQLVDNVLKYKRIDGVVPALRTIADRWFADGRQLVEVASRLGGVEVTTMIVWGTEDRIIPPAHASAAPSGARVTVLDGVGHSPHMEAAGEVNRLLTGFLD